MVFFNPQPKQAAGKSAKGKTKAKAYKPLDKIETKPVVFTVEHPVYTGELPESVTTSTTGKKVWVKPELRVYRRVSLTDVNIPPSPDDVSLTEKTVMFDRNRYQREYMRKRRVSK